MSVVPATASVMDLALLGVRVRVCLPAHVRASLLPMFAAFAGSDRPTGAPTRVDVRPHGDGWSAELDNAVTAYGDDPAALAVAAVTRAAVDHTPLLAVHAGVLCGPDGTVVVPGPSGHGKSTLTACAVRAGFGYLSDEVFAVDRRTGAVHGFPRPLALDERAWMLAGLPEGDRPRPGEESLVGSEALGALGEARPVTDIVLVSRNGGSASLVRSTPGQAAAALLRHSFNHYADPAGSFARVAAVVRQARVWHAIYREADELASLMAQRLIEGAEGLPGAR